MALSQENLNEVHNFLQLSAIVEVVARAGSEICGNEISETVLGQSFYGNEIHSLIAARIKKLLSEKGVL